MVEYALSEAHRLLLTTGADSPGIGGALITTVQVAPGAEHAYNAWYGGDHYYAGMLYLPYCFAGSRWIATKRHRELRAPEGSAFVSPLTDGNFLNMYFAAAGRMDEVSEDIVTALDRLTEEGRMHRDGNRRQVFTAHQDYVGAVYRDTSGPRDYQAFDYPYSGCVLEIIDAPTPDGREDLERWLVDEHLPAVIEGSPAAMCLVFRTKEYTGGGYVAKEMPIDRFTRRVALLWMLEGDPADEWETFEAESALVDRSGLGRMEYVSGYIRLQAGTDKHLDQLY